MGNPGSDNILRTFDGWTETYDEESHAFPKDDADSSPFIPSASSDSSSCVAGELLFLQTELCDMDLDHWIQTNPSVEDRWDVTLQIARGIKFIHDANLIHRDIKSDNILIKYEYDAGWFGKPVAKVCDFGLSRSSDLTPCPDCILKDGTKIEQWMFCQRCDASGTIHRPVFGGVGCEDYLSPEAHDPNVKIDNKVDIWAFGITIGEIFDGSTGEPHAHIFVDNLLRRNPKKRWSAADLASELERYISESTWNLRDYFNSEKHTEWKNYLEDLNDLIASSDSSDCEGLMY